MDRNRPAPTNDELYPMGFARRVCAEHNATPGGYGWRLSTVNVGDWAAIEMVSADGRFLGWF